MSIPVDSLSAANSAVEIADRVTLERHGCPPERNDLLDVLDGFQLRHEVVVDHAAGAVHEEVGATQLVDLVDREVLDAGSRNGHERHEVHADEQRVRGRGGALWISGGVVGGESPFETEPGRDGSRRLADEDREQRAGDDDADEDRQRSEAQPCAAPVEQAEDSEGDEHSCENGPFA